MIPPQFEYHAPSTMDEALGLLDRYGGEAKVLAGGHSLIPLMKLRLAEPKALIDINRIPNLSYIREEGSQLKIGAMSRTNDLLRTPIIRQQYPIFSDAASEIADPLVRNLGTVGGNVCHADPGNDLPAVMISLGGEMGIVGPKGARTISADKFYRDSYVTALEPNEILVELRVPKSSQGQGNAYLKIEKRVGDFAIAGAAANLVLGSGGRVEKAGIALTGVGPTAISGGQAAHSLNGQMPDDAHLGEAARLAAAAASPVGDLRGPAEYKRAVTEVLVRRALHRSLDRAKGGR